MQDFQLGEWRVNARQNLLSGPKGNRQLDHTPMQLLLYLAANPQRIIGKDELLEQVWSGKVVGEEVLTVAISQIRRALDDTPKQPRFIKTIPGKGYQLIADVRDCQAPSRWTRVAWLATAATVLLFISVWFWHFRDAAPDYPPQARDAYQQGRYLLSRGDPQSVRQALSQFEQALTLSPNMGEARWARVQARLRTEEQPDYEALLAELENATLQAAQFAPAHLSLAQLLFTHRWDFAGAGDHFRQALALDESDPQTHFLYSQYLLAMGQFDPALHHVERYIDLSPKDYAVPVVAWVYAMANQPHKASLELDKIAHVSQPDLSFHMSAQAIKKHLGDEQGAFDHLQVLMAQGGFTPTQLVMAHSRFSQDGLSAVFRWLLEQKADVNIGHYAPPLSWARYAVAAGETQQAMTWLQQAVDERQTEVLWMAIDPWYAPLRSLPEFQALIQKIGITS